MQRFLKEEPPQYGLVKQHDRILIHGCDVWTFEFPAFPIILQLSATEQIHYRNVNLVHLINIGFRIFDPSSVVRPLTFHILMNSSEATGPI
jgi:hypothetical protein